MLSVTGKILIVLLVSFSMLAGYFIGVSTEEEIIKSARKIKADNINYYIFSVITGVILGSSAYLSSFFYYAVAAVLIVTNMVLLAMYNALKTDLTETIKYQTVFIFVSFLTLIIVSFL
ncbi:hypothetical protein M1293_02750 [Candidatus Parvarchaeota archaeon]|nr:hypothetical protein [Candidatus Parvarchaeota archaeon]